ncbi:protein Lines homolog 1 [Bombina bombina]|uniref:protein Lines homolog 1 n=1 Tax=Bombina bombina TaxID=8345 RepID=UPI00235AB4BB|nr:protein Lines homolog 1 [Bombina bombina]XP_053573577.1 protein Lines homolog 1 [Bombina bombina]
MEDTVLALRELHRKLLLSSPLDIDVQQYATLLTLQNLEPTLIRLDECSVDVENVQSARCLRDITALQLCLMQTLITKAENPMTEHNVRCQYTRVLERLQQTGVDAALISLSLNCDKVLSHLSSKCLSCLVLFQLRCQFEVNDLWLQYCLKTLCEYPKSPALVPCLTSLLLVCKGILRDQNLQQAATLLHLLKPLDKVFGEFCSSIIYQHCSTPCQQLDSDIHLSCFLDLLEVLVALKTKLKLNLPLCEQVLLITLPQTLSLISSSFSYFVKKQIILVLKRCLLNKAGEHFLPSLLPVPQISNPQVDYVSALGEVLLSAVRQGWLLQVPVSERCSSFGGANETSECGPDLVTLGAVCLSVLKALEAQVLLSAPSNNLTVDLQISMEHLLVFLKLHLGNEKLMHHCEWVSVIFIEQDDDMLEVAMSLLKMYIKCHRHWFNPPFVHESEDEKRSWNGQSHQSGSDPHCIFLLLLKNVAFDASVLLDFLISSETCFLEYLVRYLKHLRDDWSQFSFTCTLFEKLSVQQPSICSSPYTGGEKLGNESSGLSHTFTYIAISANNPTTVTEEKNKCSGPSNISSSKGQRMGTIRSLVDYDSSDDSELECTDKQFPALTCSQDANSIDTKMGKLNLRVSPVCQSTPAHAKVRDKMPLPEMQVKTVKCLEELYQAVSRLHGKKLFPYNPSALLRLLALVCSLNKTTSTSSS